MELDNLKKVWKEQQTATFSRDEILKMLKQKSSSIAKWIFYISLGEFAFWILFALALPDSKLNLSENSKLLIEVLNWTNYTVIVVFIIAFFLNFQKIKAEQNITQLLRNVFRTRKTVQYYIIYNLSMFAISIGPTLVWVIFNDYTILRLPKELKSDTAFWVGFVFGTLLLTAIILVILYFFYRLLYGFLLRRLQNNYQEIKELQ